jgi:hypothetical protein
VVLANKFLIQKITNIFSSSGMLSFFCFVLFWKWYSIAKAQNSPLSEITLMNTREEVIPPEMIFISSEPKFCKQVCNSIGQALGVTDLSFLKAIEDCLCVINRSVKPTLAVSISMQSFNHLKLSLLRE